LVWTYLWTIGAVGDRAFELKQQIGL